MGYCIGTADTASFARRWRDEFVQTVDEKLIPRPGVETSDADMEKEVVKWLRRAVWGAECSMLQGKEDALRKWPAHLHVDILPGWQRRGWGRKLVETFCEGVRRQGVKGVHLDVGKGNAGAKAFYKGLGFEECEGMGKDEGAVTLGKRVEY